VFSIFYFAVIADELVCFSCGNNKKVFPSGIANSDKNRIVGHYWLRNSPIAPFNELKTASTRYGILWIVSRMRYILATFAGKMGNSKMYYALASGVLRSVPSSPVAPSVADHRIKWRYFSSTIWISMVSI
jgi:hypothetical protein